ncbi:DUF397 domain-containing protein [Amycolatopsis orientalis]|uniref:DUF397 domain-containing protein n=1 Tax=Amycolatopsis orientalis TaxID=31958 RepID=UPI001392475A|nr:DUF397 domain-containing protein [Amycolatopsis orientalis]
MTVAFDPDKAEWRKSSYSSGGEANCVEIAFHDDVVSVRDSKDPQGGYLTLPREGWQCLLDGIRSGGEHQQDDEQLPAPPEFG